jgi:hypothetical protein
MVHLVTKLTISQRKLLYQKTSLISMTRWTKKMRMMMRKQSSRLFHLKSIRSVSVHEPSCVLGVALAFSRNKKFVQSCGCDVLFEELC